MPNINIKVENKRATAEGAPVIVCGNSDYTATFAFDSAWGLNSIKTARFVYVKRGEVQHEDVVFEGTTVAVPVLADIDFVKVGVFEGNLCTTTPARIPCVASILCGSGELQEPTPDVYNQIMALFNEQAPQIEQNKEDITELRADVEELQAQNVEQTIAGTCTGNPATTTDSTAAPFNCITLYGASEQDGEPTPEAPVDIVSVGDRENILNITATTETMRGVDFIINDDKSITINGTATGSISFKLSGDLIPAGTYRVLGSYSADCDIVLIYAISTPTYIQNEAKGEGKPFDVTIDDAISSTSVYIRINEGTTLNNVTICPAVLGESELVVKSCGKNELENRATTQTIYGVDFTVNNNNSSVTVNGTATEMADFYLIKHTEQSTLLKGDYVLSGCPSGGEETKYLLIVGSYVGKNYSRLGADYGNGVDISLNQDTPMYAIIRVRKGVTVNNLTFYPMLRHASIEDDTYEPYVSSQANLSLADDLRGIPVASGGNYTDANGQQWICDTLEKYADGTGKLIQRVYSKVFNGSETWTPYSGNDGFYQFFTAISNCKNMLNVMCSHFTTMELNDRYTKTGIIKYNDNILRFAFQPSYNITTTEEFTTWLSNNNVTVLYELKEPIVTDLTAEQVAALEQLQSFEGCTSIFTDELAGLKVEYFKNTDNGRVVGSLKAEHVKLWQKLNELLNQ